jgi:hypothetical protein
MHVNRRFAVQVATAAIAALLGSGIAAAASSSTAFRTATQLGYSQGDDWEPAVAVDGSWVYVFWMHFGTPPSDCSLSAVSHMVFQSSADGGKTWGPPRSIACQAGYQADAQLVVTQVGKVHRVYASWMDSNQANSPIFVAFSDDFGATWSSPVAATKLDHGGSGGDKDILVANGRQVWVTWEHLTTNIVAYTRNIEASDFVPVSVPNPNGLVSLASGGGRDSHGNLYFTWGGVAKQGGANGPTTLFVGRSPDDGASWTTSTIDVSATAPAPSGAGWDYFGASTAFAIIPRPRQATDRLVAIYNKGLTPGAPERIYTKYSDDNGATWSSAQDLSTAPSGAWHGFPAAVADAGGVRVTWMDNRVNPTCQTDAACGTWNVWERTSVDGATGWSPELRLDGPAVVDLASHAYQTAAGFSHPYGDYQWLAGDSAGRTYAVWGEGPSYAGPGTIYFTRN